MKRYPWVVLGVALFLNVIAYVDRTMLLGFSPQITQELKLSNTQFGVLAGVVWVLSFGFMALFLGSLADRFNRVKVVAGGMFVWSLCTAASGLADTFTEMVAARFLVASGEAALVPAATALLAEIFDERRRGMANGVFFIGLPLGMGSAFLLSGSVGVLVGWRNTFLLLGIVGMAISLALTMVHDEGRSDRGERGEPFLRQMRALWRELSAQPVLILTITGIVFAHLVFTQNSFVQLWMVRERGADAAQVASRFGALQIVFGTLGAVTGGIVGDRLAAKFKGGHAAFPALSGAVCIPLAAAFHVVGVDHPLFYAGMAASVFLPLSLYGCTLAIIQGSVPVSMRSSVTGFMMLCINVFAIAMGSLAVGAISDRLTRSGHAAPLTTMLQAMDVALVVSFVCYFAAARLLARKRVRDAIAASIAVAVLCGGIPVASAAEFVDPIDAPATLSALASRKQLNAITAAGRRLVAVGQRGHVLLSDDGGRSWSQAAVPVSSDLTAVTFPTAERGWAVGHDGVVIATADGGRTWTKQLDGRQIGPILARSYADYQGPDRAAVMQQVQLLSERGADVPLLDVWFDDDGTGYAVGAFNVMLRTEDGGRSWTPWLHRTENPTGLHLYAIRRVAGDLYVVGEQGLVLKLDPGAQRFKGLRLEYRGSFFGVIGDSRSVVVYGLRGHVFRSTDRGVSWRRVETGLDIAITGAAVLGDGRLALVTQAGQVLVAAGEGEALRLVTYARPAPASGVAAGEQDAIVLVGALGASVGSVR